MPEKEPEPQFHCGEQEDPSEVDLTFAEDGVMFDEPR